MKANLYLEKYKFDEISSIIYDDKNKIIQFWYNGRKVVGKLQTILQDKNEIIIEKGNYDGLA